MQPILQPLVIDVLLLFEQLSCGHLLILGQFEQVAHELRSMDELDELGVAGADLLDPLEEDVGF